MARSSRLSSVVNPQKGGSGVRHDSQLRVASALATAQKPFYRDRLGPRQARLLTLPELWKWEEYSEGPSIYCYC